MGRPRRGHGGGGGGLRALHRPWRCPRRRSGRSSTPACRRSGCCRCQPLVDDPDAAWGPARRQAGRARRSERGSASVRPPPAAGFAGSFGCFWACSSASAAGARRQCGQRAGRDAVVRAGGRACAAGESWQTATSSGVGICAFVLPSVESSAGLEAALRVSGRVGILAALVARRHPRGAGSATLSWRETRFWTLRDSRL